MKTGTCYFPSYGAALRYYRPYVTLSVNLRDAHARHQLATNPTHALRALVDQKLNAGEIHIGKPPLKPGQTLTIEDNRYHVTEAAQ